MLCRVQLLVDYLGFPPHTVAIPALTGEMDSSQMLNLSNLSSEMIRRNTCVFKNWTSSSDANRRASGYLTLGGGHLCKQGLRHLGSLHLVLDLLVDGGADVENTTVCPQPSVCCDWGQSRLKRERQEDDDN